MFCFEGRGNFNCELRITEYELGGGRSELVLELLRKVFRSSFPISTSRSPLTAVRSPLTAHRSLLTAYRSSTWLTPVRQAAHCCPLIAVRFPVSGCPITNYVFFNATELLRCRLRITGFSVAGCSFCRMTLCRNDFFGAPSTGYCRCRRHRTPVPDTLRSRPPPFLRCPLAVVR